MARQFLHYAVKGSARIQYKEETSHCREHAVIDQEAMYIHVIGLLVCHSDLNFQEVLTKELTAYPSSMFHADGQRWVAARKSTVKNIQVDVSQHLTMSQQLSWWMSAVIWTLEWPAHGTVATFISGFKMALSAVVWS